MQEPKNKTHSTSPKSCWIITEGMIGTENQCRGIVQNLDVTADIIKISLRQPWKAFSPWLRCECAYSIMPKLAPPWPDIVIASGRKAIAACRYIKKQSNGKTFIVFVQTPKISPKDFDLIIAPYHDQLTGDNVITTHGAPNLITQAKLNQAKQDFSSLFAPLSKRRVAVLIGGNSRTHTITPGITHSFCQTLQSIDASYMITASRRTPVDCQDIIKSTLGSEHFIWDGTGDNPYLGMLAWADHIIVTEDSVSMISDAATAGKPVSVIKLDGQSKRFDLFHQHFQDIGVFRPLTGNLDHWTYEPINDAKTAAQAIIEHLKKK